MTEDEIAQQLKPKTDPDDIPESSWDKVEEVKTDERFTHELPENMSLEKTRWLDYFQVPSASRYDARIETWLTQVIDWARDEAGSSEYTDVLRVIHDQERIMGNPLKRDRLSSLARFAVIRKQRNRLAAEERALYGF